MFQIEFHDARTCVIYQAESGLPVDSIVYSLEVWYPDTLNNFLPVCRDVIIARSQLGVRALRR